eukprot:m.129705 g.129705  ORF g.129705 m.129705 type:complete len:728 (-) comp11271_c0_seq1:3845-6028(-)
MLGSSRPTRTRVVQTPEMSDHDLAAEQKSYLLQAIQRQLALPVGRGMFTLNTVRPIITQAIRIPELNLEGRADSGAAVTLEDTDLSPESLAWPRFHNGVAAGLRIVPPSDTQLSTTWITYHRPDNNQLNDGHAGFIMALGLLGHLRKISTMTIFDYLSKGHESTSIGLLLGLAAAEQGTMNSQVAKMLSIHVPALLPTTSAEIEVSPKVQTASILGVGLLYMETMQSRMTEVLLREIGRVEGPDSDFCTEAYALSAGLALGMVNLGKGLAARNRGGLDIPDRLRQYMEGTPATSTHHRGAGLGGGRSTSRDKAKQWTVNVTCPGATVALGLMFLKTNNRTIASRLEIPNTKFHLDFIRPDCLLLRALCYHLVLWDDIGNTEEWVLRQVPSTVREMRTTDEVSVDKDLFRNAYVSIVAGVCFAVGFRFTGTRDAHAIKALKYFAKDLRSMQSQFAETGRTILEGAINVVILSLSLVNVGTGDLGTLRLIRSMHKRVGNETNFGTHMAVHMALGILFLGGGSSTFDTSSNRTIAVLLVSLFPQFPIARDDNRYHLQALRHMYVLAAVRSDTTDSRASALAAPHSKGVNVGVGTPLGMGAMRTHASMMALSSSLTLHGKGNMHDVALALCHCERQGATTTVPQAYVHNLRASLWRWLRAVPAADLQSGAPTESVRQLLRFCEVPSTAALRQHAGQADGKSVAEVARSLKSALGIRDEASVALARILCIST